MHLEYVTYGPTEVGRSGEYEDIEVILGEGDDGKPLVWFMGKIGEDWGEVAHLEPRDEFNTGIGVASWEGGPTHHTGFLEVRSVFVSI